MISLYLYLPSSKYILWFLCIAQQKLDREIKDREEKYTELDSKFQRLHKRAKQRIQEVQKVNSFFGLFVVVYLFMMLLYCS
jgi:hypothetical protein